MSRLVQLRSLQLGSNRISLLPPSMATLHGLTALNARNNVLTDVPATMRSMTALKYLALGSNKLERVGAMIT